MSERTLTSWTAQHYNDRLAEIATRLRDLADAIEREGQPSEQPDAMGRHRYTSAVERVHHTILWGVANIGADHLIGDAHDADRAEHEDGGS